jgi:hypothetical protein
MKTISQAITMTFSAGVLLALSLSNASAGCGDLTTLPSPLQFSQASAAPRLLAPSEEAASAAAHGSGSSGASITGLWKVQFVSQGNGSHNPPIPDGAIVDFGYSEWHSDGTEIMNSGGHEPATQNFCLGVWGQTGFLTFVLNHFALSYDATSQALTNYVNIRQQVTLSPSGDSFAGTFTIKIFDTKGNQVDQVVGTINATRLTVDSTLP